MYLFLKSSETKKKNNLKIQDQTVNTSILFFFSLGEGFNFIDLSRQQLTLSSILVCFCEF